jgi:hypothetical protein
METELTKEQQAEINQEYRAEELREQSDGFYQSWLSDNIEDLKEEFIKDNIAEFNNFLEQEIIDDERDIEYWKDTFCKEENDEDFDNYCRDEFRLYEEVHLK